MRERSVRFPAHDFQGLPILFGLMLIGSVASELTDEGLPLAIGAIGLVGLFVTLYYKCYIIRPESSDYVVFRKQLTSKLEISRMEIPLADLSYNSYRRSSTSDGGHTSYTPMVNVTANGRSILKFHGYSEELRPVLAELLGIERVMERNRELTGNQPIPIEDKEEETMINARISDGRLRGDVVGWRKQESKRVKTSSIVGMEFEKDGTTRVETRNTVYVVGMEEWKEMPDNHPSLSDEEWWS